MDYSPVAARCGRAESVLGKVFLSLVSPFPSVVAVFSFVFPVSSLSLVVPFSFSLLSRSCRRRRKGRADRKPGRRYLQRIRTRRCRSVFLDRRRVRAGEKCCLVRIVRGGCGGDRFEGSDVRPGACRSMGRGAGYDGRRFGERVNRSALPALHRRSSGRRSERRGPGRPVELDPFFWPELRRDRKLSVRREAETEKAPDDPAPFFAWLRNRCYLLAAFLS